MGYPFLHARRGVGAGHKLGVGRACYDSTTARRLTGAHNVRPVVHYDYLYLEN